MRSKMNPNSHPRFTNVLFTSISPFVNSSSLFPSHDRRIGLTVTCGYHPEHKRVMVLVEEEQPSFLSTNIGEYIEPNEAESTIRKSCRAVADTCHKQAAELIQHAERLEKLANQNLPIIDVSKIDKDKDHQLIISSRYEEPVKKRNHTTSSLPQRVESSHRSVSLDMDDI